MPFILWQCPHKCCGSSWVALCAKPQVWWVVGIVMLLLWFAAPHCGWCRRGTGMGIQDLREWLKLSEGPWCLRSGTWVESGMSEEAGIRFVSCMLSGLRGSRCSSIWVSGITVVVCSHVPLLNASLAVKPDWPLPPVIAAPFPSNCGFDGPQLPCLILPKTIWLLAFSSWALVPRSLIAPADQHDTPACVCLVRMSWI